MRFRLPKDGDERIITKFAWLPINIVENYRWLERVTVKQNYNEYHGWMNMKFIDETAPTERLKD